MKYKQKRYQADGYEGFLAFLLIHSISGSGMKFCIRGKM
jgi:hypothetical protein